MDWRNLPDWENIPEPPSGLPQGCAWGLFDQNGERDQVGTLNLLTSEIILKAKEEIEKGDSVCLNWSLDNVQAPAVTRKKLEHKIISLRPLGYAAYDDEITINTQSSSQWDGLRHWGHQATGLHYNNLPHEDIQDVDYWTLRGGIVGRGVLIDYHAWAQARNLPHPATERTTISVTDLEEVAKAQGTELRPADILIIRTGWTEWYNRASEAERSAATAGEKHIGLERTEKTVKWLWNKHFAAVASDTLAFEVWPTEPPYSKIPVATHHQSTRLTYKSGLHDWLLAMWGCPIGELWNLEELAEKCRSYRKWSFFIASAPLNVVGGVASPPNVVAIL